jgi:hypothetical protein
MDAEQRGGKRKVLEAVISKELAMRSISVTYTEGLVLLAAVLSAAGV